MQGNRYTAPPQGPRANGVHAPLREKMHGVRQAMAAIAAATACTVLGMDCCSSYLAGGPRMGQQETRAGNHCNHYMATRTWLEPRIGVNRPRDQGATSCESRTTPSTLEVTPPPPNPGMITPTHALPNAGTMAPLHHTQQVTPCIMVRVREGKTCHELELTVED